MSKGSPIVQVRVPADLLEEINNSIASCNENRQGEPYTLSSWILTAVHERLNKLARSSKTKRIPGLGRIKAPARTSDSA